MILTKTLPDSQERQTALLKYVASNNNITLEGNELEHVAMCLDHILDWYETGRPLGGFLTTLLKNDLKECVLHADDTNRKALLTYVYFLCNELPLYYKERAKELH